MCVESSSSMVVLNVVFCLLIVTKILSECTVHVSWFIYNSLADLLFIMLRRHNRRNMVKCLHVCMLLSMVCVSVFL